MAVILASGCVFGVDLCRIAQRRQRDQKRKSPADTEVARLCDARPDRLTQTLLSSLIAAQLSVSGSVKANKAKVEIVQSESREKCK